MNEMQELKNMISNLAATVTEQLTELKADVNELKQRANEQQVMLSAIKTGNEHTHALLTQVDYRVSVAEGDIKKLARGLSAITTLQGIQADDIQTIKDRLNN